MSPVGQGDEDNSGNEAQGEEETTTWSSRKREALVV